MEIQNEEVQLTGEGSSMVKLWIFRLKIGMSRVEQVPTVYRVDVYTGAIQDGIIVMDDIPENYRERVQAELDGESRDA